MPSPKLCDPILKSQAKMCVCTCQVMSLEVDHGIYVGPGGRVNVSSLTDAAAKQVAEAVIAVVK